jgi:hypothetical protein
MTSATRRTLRATVTRFVGVTVLLGVGTVGPAFADWTFAAFLGGTRTQTTSLTLTQPAASTDVTLSPVHYRSESLKPPIYYGYRVGHFPGSGWLGIEGEFIHVKVVAETARTTQVHGIIGGETARGSVPLSSVIERFSITHGVNLLLVNAVARRRVGFDGTAAPRWILSARLGAGASIPHAESTIGDTRLEGYQWGSLSAQAAAGIEMRVAKRLYLLGEYKLTHSVQNVMVAGGTADTPLTTHHVVAGMAFTPGADRHAP